jgi:hypothetical protein
LEKNKNTMENSTYPDTRRAGSADATVFGRALTFALLFKRRCIGNPFSGRAEVRAGRAGAAGGRAVAAPPARAAGRLTELSAKRTTRRTVYWPFMT